eukprot:337062_1
MVLSEYYHDMMHNRNNNNYNDNCSMLSSYSGTHSAIASRPLRHLSTPHNNTILPVQSAHSSNQSIYSHNYIQPRNSNQNHQPLSRQMICANNRYHPFRYRQPQNNSVSRPINISSLSQHINQNNVSRVSRRINISSLSQPISSDNPINQSNRTHIKYLI